MPADFSTYMPTPVAATEHGTLKGMRLFDLQTAGAGWKAVVDSDDADNAARHEFHKLIDIDPADKSKPIFEELAAHANGIRQTLRRGQWIAYALHTIKHGIFGFDVQDLANATNKITWELVSVGDKSATLIRRSDMSDPNEVTIQVVSLNTEWIPGENTRYITTSSTAKMPAECVMTISGNSKLAGHGGWLVKNWQCPNAVGVDETFTVNLHTPIFAEAAQKHDSSDTNPILVSFEFYVGDYRPDWVHIVDDEDMYAKQTTQTIDGPFGESEIVISATKRARWPEGNSYWFTATGNLSGGGTVDLTSLLIGKLQITHVGASSYKTAVDITDVYESLEDYESITFKYWLEDSGDDAKPVGGCRCSHMEPDWSGSTYDRTISDGDERWICTNANGCSASPRKNCYDTTVSGFALATPTPLGGTKAYEVWRQITGEYFLQIIQLMEGFDNTEVVRRGVPSLAQSSGQQMTLPVGYHPTQVVIRENGWAELDTSGDTVVQQDSYRQNHDKAETHGPAGGNVARVKEIGTDAEDDFVKLSDIIEVGPDIDPYKAEASGTLGHYQRVDRSMKFAVNNINASAGMTEGVGCKLVKGLFDGDFQSVTDPEAAVYTGYLEITKNLDVYNRDSTVQGFNKFNAQVAEVIDNGDGSYDLDLENRVIEAGSLHPTLTKTELVTRWKSGGTNVKPEERLRVFNYLSSTRYFGPLTASTAKVGNCVRFSDSSFLLSFRNTRAWITEVHAYGGNKGSWKPDAVIEDYARASGLSYLVFGNKDEEVSTVTVTRNGGAVTLGAYEGFPFPLGLAKDAMVWTTRLTNDGNRAIIMKFSSLNMTGVAADEVLDIEIVTTLNGGSGATYNVTGFNAQTGRDGTMAAPGGLPSDTAQCLYTLYSEDGIESVDVYANYISPSSGVYAQAQLTRAASFPSSWSELGVSEFGVSELDENTWIIAFPAQHMGSFFEIKVTTGGVDESDENVYYDAAIAPHGASLPVEDDDLGEYAEFGRRRDRIRIVPDRALPDELSSLVGKTITITNDGGIHYSEDGKRPVLELFKGDDESTAALTEGTDYVLEAAARRAWLKVPFDDDEASTTIEDGDAIFSELWVADRVRLLQSTDITGLSKTCERMLDE